ncbi:MAG: hypothetical protein NVSMB48_09650 [Marmoricola sp.]|uniref:hypothetical protein n=1 Tax=Nocardioides sp. Root140 TaxID=1736460 RepID=UPI000B20C1D8|nr:hypothetical protein [Nocardioides sp. Root140]
MALTRRTARFGDLARAVEDQLREQGLAVEPEVLDQILRNRIDTVAEVMRVSPRTALGYAPADLPVILAETIVDATRTTPPSAASCGRRQSLHHVKVIAFSDLTGVGELGGRLFGPVA